MKLLVVGANSALGRELLKLLQQRGVDYAAPSLDEDDIADPLRMARIVTRSEADQVVNLLAFAAGSQLAPELAEQDAPRCALFNAELPGLLAQVCDHLHIPLTHLSTVLVFSGNKKLAYSEDDQPAPLGVYGSAALLGEQTIQQTLPRHVILRSGWLFGAGQDEVIQRWLHDIVANDGSMEVWKRKLNPTPVEDLARVIMAVALQIDCQAPVWGTYHYASLESRREHEFAQDVVRAAARHDEAIYRLLDHLSIHPRRAEPPLLSNATLGCKKIFDTFGIKQRSWQGALQQLVKSYHD